MSLKVLIHADGGVERGLGHVMRSIAIAEEAQDRGHEIVWSGWLDQTAIDVLARFGFDRAHAWDSPTDAAGLLGLIRAVQPDVLHVDSYDLELERADVPESVLVSNLQDGAFGARSADLATDPNLDADQRLAWDSPTARFMRPGISFVPLRRSVLEAKGRWVARGVISRILVVLGGSDPLGLSVKVAAELAGLAPDLCVVARPDLHAEILAIDPAIDVTSFVDDLPSLASQHDLVVTAAGTSVWELCHIGVPFAVLCAADNQADGYAAVVDTGVAVGLGDFTELGSGRLRESVAALLPHESQARADLGATLVDGLGSWRMVSAWESLVGGFAARSADGRLRIRPATEDDADLLLAWRNDDDTRRWSRNTAEVERDDHLRWLANTLTREGRLLLVAETEQGHPVASVRWDEVGRNVWEVSITVAPEARGAGLGNEALRAGEAYLVGQVGATVCAASVHSDNVASRKLFHGAGYLPFKPVDAHGFETLAVWRAF